MRPCPPGAARTVRLLAGLLLLRFRNRLGNRFRRRKKSAPLQLARTGTGRKSTVGWVGPVFIGLIMAFNGVNLGSSLLSNLRETIGPTRDAQGRWELNARSYAALKAYEAKYGDDDSPKAQARLRSALYRESTTAEDKKGHPHLNELITQFHERGLGGFVNGGRENDFFLPHLGAWHSTEAAPKVSKAIGAILLLLFLTWLSLDFGSANQDLGRVEWTLEWLFTMPVSAFGLFTAQLLGFAITEPLMWCGAWPVMTAVFASADWGWWSILLGAGVAFYLSVLIASLRVSGETLLRCILAPARLKNLQALFTVLGMVGLFSLVANVTNKGIAETFLSWASRLPQETTWIPVMLPGRIPALGAAEPAGTAVIAVMFAAFLLFPAVAVMTSAWLVRGGLVGVSGAYAGKRRSARSLSADAAPSGAGFARGIVAKDLRLLLRDRNFLVQTLVVPAMVIGFQLVIHGGIIKAVRTQFQQASVLAFAVGGYVLIATAMSALSVEGNSLWMLYTFPQSISQVLLRKTKLWAGIAMLYTLIVLAACALANQYLQPGDMVFAVLALTGVLIYAFIAAGIGILATDPLETEVRRRVRPEMVQLYMILAAMYAHALYAPSAWTRLAQIVLSTLLAFALWQKVHDRAPLLLDPVVTAPPSISLSDGLIAALAFFVLQGIFQFTLASSGMALAAALFVAFVIAGALVTGLTFYIFWRANVPEILVSVGLRRRPGDSMGTSKALLLGLAGGVAAALFACAYLRALDWVPALQSLKNQTLKLPFDPGIWLPILAIGAAPIFEEFIFRGVVFRGLLRSLDAKLAILGSAAIFAIVHPAISVLPVFVLGLVAAWTVYRSGLLISSITTHMIYNAAVVAMNWYSR